MSQPTVEFDDEGNLRIGCSLVFGTRILPVYKRCSACDGMGSIKQVDPVMTTAGWNSMTYTCNTCRGTGKEETEYFVEIE